MTLSDQITTDMPVFFNTDEFSETVTYNDGTGGVPVTVVLEQGAALPGVNGSCAVVNVSAVEVSSPQYRHTFTQADGTVWTVHRDDKKGLASSKDGDVWSIKVSSSERFNGWNK